MNKVILITLVLTSAPSLAQTETSSATPPGLAGSRYAEPAGRGVGFGYDTGSWGGEWMQGVRVRVPVFDHFALQLRGLAVSSQRPGADRWDLGGRLELIGHGPVMLDLVRLYGGGGVQLFHPVTDVPDPELFVGGGGYFGFEFFLTRVVSFFLEVGGQSGVADELGAGASIEAGISAYPF